MLLDVEYLGHRAVEERAAAMEAAHPKARHAHVELAQRYESLARAIARRERLLHVVDAA